MSDDFEGRHTAIALKDRFEVPECEKASRWIREGVIEDEKNRKNDEKDEEDAIRHAEPLTGLVDLSLVPR